MTQCLSHVEIVLESEECLGKKALRRGVHNETGHTSCGRLTNSRGSKAINIGKTVLVKARSPAPKKPFLAT